MSEAQAVTEGSRYYIPEADSSERRIAIFIFLLGCCYLWLFRRFTMMDPDEGIILQGAQRILNGQVLYRDFFSFLTPGSFYQTALVLRIFGNSIVVARTMLVVVGALVSSISYLLARRVCSRAVAISTAILVIVATLPYRFVVLHNWDSTLWACLATYAGLRWFETGRPNWAFWTGMGGGLTFLFEQSKGAGVLLGVAICVGVVWLLQRPAKTVSTAGTLALVAGIFIPIVATFAYFASQHAVGPMVADLAWPFRHYSAANKVFYGYQNWNDATRKMLFGSGSLLVRFITLWAVSPCFLIPAIPIISTG
ncbi:MAG TPA: glycosyltransferase family 39 protein, partial [Candidatus Acidoferrales bacterium]|nr:glycosyltransferase family 39 protein [Candidatus Acidoferrales bacterium]